jgi:hypothetical protein
MKRRYDHKYDGESKGKTKNCEECKFKVNFYEREICCWGKHFKYLIPSENPRMCEYKEKEPPKENALEYVIYAKKNNLFGKSINYKKQARQLELEY